MVNLKKKSTYLLTEPHRKIDSLGITGLISDKEGNQWFSTLQNGLARINKGTEKGKHTALQLPNTEVIRAITVWKNFLAVATSLGKMYLQNDSVKMIKKTINPGFVNLESLHVSHDSSLLAGSNYLLYFDPVSGNFKKGSHTSSVKDISSDDSGNTYVANAYSLKKNLTDGKAIVRRSKRCWTAKYASYNQTVYSSFSDGLFYFKNFEEHPLTVDEQTLFPSSVATKK